MGKDQYFRATVKRILDGTVASHDEMQDVYASGRERMPGMVCGCFWVELDKHSSATSQLLLAIKAQVDELGTDTARIPVGVSSNRGVPIAAVRLDDLVELLREAKGMTKTKTDNQTYKQMENLIDRLVERER